MDPLSIAVSVATVIGLTTRLTLTLRDLRSDLRSAAGELDTIEQELNGLNLVLARLQLYAESGHEVAGQDGTNEALRGILRACERTILEIETKATSAAQNLRGKHLGQLKHSLSWPSLKRELQDLRNQLERNKSAILLSLHLESLAFQKAAMKSHKETDGRIRDLLQQVEEVKVFQEQVHRGNGISSPELLQDGSNQHLGERHSHEQPERPGEEGERTNAMKRHVSSAGFGDAVEIGSAQAPRKRFRQAQPDIPQPQGPGPFPDASQPQPRDDPAPAMDRAIPRLGMEPEAPGRINRPMQASSRAVIIEAQSSMSEWLSGFEH